MSSMADLAEELAAHVDDLLSIAETSKNQPSKNELSESNHDQSPIQRLRLEERLRYPESPCCLEELLRRDHPSDRTKN